MDALSSHSSTQESLDWLREQVEMRVIGLCWVEFRTNWSSSKDEDVGSIQLLTGDESSRFEVDCICTSPLGSAAIDRRWCKATFADCGALCARLHVCVLMSSTFEGDR